MNKTDKVKINNIEVQIGDVKHKLTLEQAKDLQNILNQLFAKEVKYVPYQPIYIERWWGNSWPYVAPAIVPTTDPYQPTWTITCGTAGASSSNEGVLLLSTNLQ
jgi:hypothetical protein